MGKDDKNHFENWIKFSHSTNSAVCCFSHNHNFPLRLIFFSCVRCSHFQVCIQTSETHTAESGGILRFYSHRHTFTFLTTSTDVWTHISTKTFSVWLPTLLFFHLLNSLQTLCHYTLHIHHSRDCTIWNVVNIPVLSSDRRRTERSTKVQTQWTKRKNLKYNSSIWWLITSLFHRPDWRKLE